MRFPKTRKNVFNDEIQKFTDEFVKKIDDALAQKEKDIMQV